MTPKKERESTKSASSVSKAGNKAIHECDVSEQVILLVDQMKTNLKDPKAYLSIDLKKFDVVRARVQSRLTVDLVRFIPRMLMARPMLGALGSWTSCGSTSTS